MRRNGVLRVLSADPGAKNFAISVNDHKINGSGIMVSKVLNTYIMENPIKKVTPQAGRDASMFLSEFSELCERFGPFDLFIAERYMARGVMVGGTIEVVGFMLGLTTHYMRMHMPECDIDLVSAAAWKNSYNSVYKDKKALAQAYKLCAATPHEMDAAFIGLYGASKLLKVKPFTSISEEKARDKLLMRIENASRAPLRNIRFKRKFYYE